MKLQTSYLRAVDGRNSQRSCDLFRPAKRSSAGAGRNLKIPDDLQAAIDAEPLAREMLPKLSAQNRFALAFRVHNLKTEAGRQKKIAAFVEILKRGETIYPQR